MQGVSECPTAGPTCREQECHWAIGDVSLHSLIADCPQINRLRPVSPGDQRYDTNNTQITKKMQAINSRSRVIEFSETNKAGFNGVELDAVIAITERKGVETRITQRPIISKNIFSRT